MSKIKFILNEFDIEAAEMQSKTQWEDGQRLHHYGVMLLQAAAAEVQERVLLIETAKRSRGRLLNAWLALCDRY